LKSLNEKEKETVAGLATTDNLQPFDGSNKDASLAERALKRRRRSIDANIYQSVNFLLPTSNICERLFSKAGFVLSDRRKSLSPVAFEQQMFLHCNSAHWDINDVNDLV